MNQVLISFESRFEQFQIYKISFGFLFIFKKVIRASEDTLRALCLNLELSLKNGYHLDITNDGFFLWKKRFFENQYQKN